MLWSASHRQPLRALGGICEARGLSFAHLVAWRALIVLLRGLAGHGLEEVVVLEPIRLHLVPVCVRRGAGAWTRSPLAALSAVSEVRT